MTSQLRSVFSVLLDDWPPEVNKKGSERYPWTKDAEKKVPFGNWSDPGQIQPDDWVRFLQKEKEKKYW